MPRKGASVSDVRNSSSDPYTTPQAGDAWAVDAASQGKVGTQTLLAVKDRLATTGGTRGTANSHRTRRSSAAGA